MGNQAQRVWGAITWRMNGYRSMARAARVMSGWDRGQRIPVAIPGGDQVPVIFCTWRRLARLPHILEMLAAQDVPVQALIWNNSPDRDTIEKAAAGATIPISVHHSPRNIGSFGRFYLARELAAAGHRRVVIIDDDEDFGPGTVRELLDSCPPRSLSAWFARTYSMADFWAPVTPAPGEQVNYVGPGGMAADTAVFSDPRLFTCPRRYWFLDDVWLSWFASRIAGYTLLRSTATLEFVEDGLNQFPALQWLRHRFWRYLARKQIRTKQQE